MAWSPVGGSRWLVLAGLAFCAGGVRAGDVETREFTVFVDGKRAGDAQMTIHRADDGTLNMHCDTDITVKVGPFKAYSYKYRGHEAWKDGRLQSLRSNCKDDGKLFDVEAKAAEDGLRVRVNGVERTVPADVWLTSYWQEPDKKKLGALVPLLDADCGRDLDARVHLVAATRQPVTGVAQEVKHYQLVGSVRVDVWYDEAGRLVRQEWVEDGHRTKLELKRIRR